MLIENRPTEWAKVYREARQNGGTVRFTTHLVPSQMAPYIGLVASYSEMNYEATFTEATHVKMRAMFALCSEQVRQGKLSHPEPIQPIERVLYRRIQRVLEMPDLISRNADLERVRDEFSL